MKAARYAMVLGVLAAGCGGGEVAPSIGGATARVVGGALEVGFDLTLSLDPSAGGPSDTWMFDLTVSASDFSFGPFPVSSLTGAAFPIKTEPGSQTTTHLGFTTVAPTTPTPVPCSPAPPPAMPGLRLSGTVYDELSGEFLPVSASVLVDVPPAPSLPPVTAALWSSGFGNPSDQSAADVAVDVAGAPVVVGYAMGTVDFGGGALDAGPTYEPFLVGLDASGHHVHSRLFTTTNSPGGSAGNGPSLVAVDAAGNIFVAGSFDATLDLGGGPLVTAGGADVFVAKLDAGGNHLWSRSFGDPNAQGLTFMGIDDAGEVALVGHFASTIDLGGGPLMPIDPTKYEHAFAAKLDASGNHVWSKAVVSLEGMSGPILGGVRGDGAIVLGGGFMGEAAFLGEAAPAGSSTQSSDLFLLQLDPAGEVAWIQHPNQVSSESTEAITHLAVGADGEIAVGVQHDAFIELGGSMVSLPAGTFVARLTPDGVYQNHADLFSAGGALHDLALAPGGHLLATGGMNPFSALLPSGLTVMAPPDGSTGNFFLELDDAGAYVRAFGQACASGPLMIGTSRAGSPDVLLAGTYTFPIDFGQGPLPVAGSGDVFIAKLPPSE